jgi:bacterioferritin-associated ferredoxin
MYVCVCNAVTDRAIREVLDHGAESLFDVQCRLPVASCCGRCEEVASQIVDEHLRKRAPQPAAA